MVRCFSSQQGNFTRLNEQHRDEQQAKSLDQTKENMPRAHFVSRFINMHNAWPKGTLLQFSARQIHRLNERHRDRQLAISLEQMKENILPAAFV